MVDHNTFVILFCVIFLCLQGLDSQQINRICADQSCRGTLSIARAIAQHQSSDPTSLNFPNGKDIRVTTKLDNPHSELWGGEINGKFGYFPKTFVKEYKVLNADPQHRVPTQNIPLSIRQKTEDTSATEANTQQDGNTSNQPSKSDQEFFEELNRKFEEQIIQEAVATKSEDVAPSAQQDGQQQKDPTETDDNEEIDDHEQGADGDPTEIPDNDEAEEVPAVQEDDPVEDKRDSEEKSSGFFQSLGSTLTGMFGGSETEVKEEGRNEQVDPNSVKQQEGTESLVHMDKDAEHAADNTGEPEVRGVNADEVKAVEGGVEGPDALGNGMQSTNESTGEIPPGDTFTRPDDGLGERLDPYSPSGEYVSRSLQSHQPSANVNQPGDEPNVQPQANIEVKVGGGSPQQDGEQADAVHTEQKLPDAEQPNDSIPSQTAGQETPSPPAEEVTPPVVPEVEDVMPHIQENDAVTEPTPMVEELPEAKEPETQPPEPQEVPPTDEPIKDEILDNLPPLEDLPEVGTDFPPLDDNPADPYATDEFHGRKIPDDEAVESKEETETANEGWLVWYARQVDRVIGLLDPLLIAVVESMPPSIQKFLEHEPFGMPKHRALLMAFGTTIMFGVISMTLMCGERKKKADPRIEKYADMEEKYFIATKEKEGLEDALEKSNKELQHLKKQSRSSEKDIEETKSDLQTIQLHNASLKQQISDLQDQAMQVQQTIEQWSASYYAKDAEAQEYQSQVATLTEAKTDLEKQLEEVKNYLDLTKTSSTDLETKVMELNEEISILQQSKDQLQLVVETWTDKVDELKGQLKETEQEKVELNEKIAFKDSELAVMKDCFKQLKAVEESVKTKKTVAENGDDTEGVDEEDEGEDDADGDTSAVVQEKISAMMDVSRVSAQLTAAEEERDHIKQKYEIEIEQRKELEDEMAKVRQENEKLQKGHQQAEKKSVEASTKLSVLQQYFKEKEVELQKELGEQEVLKKEKASLLANKDETVKTMEMEMHMAKEKVEDLQMEISKVEKDYRTQIAMQEKKAHENWLAARQAERDLKEAKSECSSLRQKLVELERLRDLDGPGPPLGPGLIRPLPQRGMLPPDMMNGPPSAYRSPPPMDGRPTSRGSGSIHGPQSPPLFRDDFRDSPFSDRPLPPHIRPPPPGGPPFPPPMHPMDRPPLPPLDRDGRPLPPLDRDGRPLPPLDRDGRPLPPLDRDGRPLPPLDRDGRPLPPPLDRNGRPLPPLDRDGRPLPPLDRDGRPLPLPEQRSPPPFDRRPPPPHDRTSPPNSRYRSTPPDLPGDRRGPPPPGYRGGPPPAGRPYPPHDGRSPPPGEPRSGV